MMENNQVFIKKHIPNIRAEQKEGYSFVMLFIAIPIYLTKTVLKTTSNVILYMKKVDLDESDLIELLNCK